VIKDTTDTQKSSSYLTLYLDIDNGERLKIKLDKRDDFTFPLVNFPFISSNILADKRVEFAFHNSSINLGVVPNTLIFWTELRC
jgi:hypothetical protein